MLFSHLIIASAGPQSRPDEELQTLVTLHGGKWSDSVHPSVTHLLLSWESAVVLSDDIKLEALPNLKPRVHRAQMHSIPLVSDEFLDACIHEGRIVDVNKYRVPVDSIVSSLTLDNNISRGGEGVGGEGESSLDPRVARVVDMLFDKVAMDKSLISMHMDVKKMYMVNQGTIREAYSILSNIDSTIASGSTMKKSTLESSLKESSDRFYSVIPFNYGHSKPPIINSKDMVKEKLEVLQSLGDIEVALKLMKSSDVDEAASLHPTDINYRKLHTKITPVETHDYIHQLIHTYAANTQQAAGYYERFQLDVLDVFEIEREGERGRYEESSKLPNKRLLWHGSRRSNFVGILTQGLRVAPPEAPVTGYFLGKGVYLADIVSKSAEYCRTTPEDKPEVGIMLLCEAALGRCFQLSHGKFIALSDLKEAGYHSTKGCGLFAPDPSHDVELDGVIIPQGKEVRQAVLGSELFHNEYVLYDPQQIRILYLVLVQFNRKR